MGGPTDAAALAQADAAAMSGSGPAPAATFCEWCEDNWVEVAGVDEGTGEPLANVPYRVYDLPTKTLLVSGILNEEGMSPRHPIPVAYQNLFVVIGTPQAMDEALANIDEAQRQNALQANAVPDWRGIPAGLNEQQFNDAYDQNTIDNGGRFLKPSVGLFEGAFYGYRHLWRSMTQGSDAAIQQLYVDDRALSFEDYQLATGAREATDGESFAGGAGQGLTFGFGDEAMSGLQSIFDPRPYDEVLAERRQLMAAEQIANPNWFMGGEIVGAAATVFVPVGAAANAARGAGIGRTMMAGAGTGAGLGAVSGFGHDEGGFVERLDGAAEGAIYGGVAGALLAGVGVLIARGVAKTRIWARARRQGGRAAPKREPYHNPNLDEQWYRADNGELRWPPNDGFAGPPQSSTLQPGTMIDRYAGRPPELDGGRYFSPAGASFESRALPYNPATQQLSQFEVLRPIPVQSGTAAPWFGQTGGATQYMTTMSTSEMLEQGFIRVVP
ncbi:TNT domain-containing protein [Actibacterium sp. 188UL27-1]|uniref:TNT domain-containing protein n=1 Tax=Actibacterium sp. 188UL27-1 TaxID=2786961 RepID=UPI00195CADF0|nr:TNT domain-containing protein [Actibacterium sp. 188UL27-1]MBM7065966.1 TNT domain-containing protein [Actibacterium sp. 188UL27-1]